jgi:hypothetical protein
MSGFFVLTRGIPLRFGALFPPLPDARPTNALGPMWPPRSLLPHCFHHTTIYCTTQCPPRSRRKPDRNLFQFRFDPSCPSILSDRCPIGTPQRLLDCTKTKLEHTQGRDSRLPPRLRTHLPRRCSLCPHICSAWLIAPAALFPSRVNLLHSQQVRTFV